MAAGVGGDLAHDSRREPDWICALDRRNEDLEGAKMHDEGDETARIRPPQAHAAINGSQGQVLGATSGTPRTVGSNGVDEAEAGPRSASMSVAFCATCV